MWLCPLSENISVPCLGWSCPAWWAENQNILTEILLIRQVTEDGESDYSYYSWLVVWWHGDDGHQTASSGRYFSPITPARSRFKWYQTGEILCSWWDLNDPHLSFVTLTIDVGLCWWRPCSQCRVQVSPCVLGQNISISVQIENWQAGDVFDGSMLTSINTTALDRSHRALPAGVDINVFAGDEAN